MADKRAGRLEAAGSLVRFARDVLKSGAPIEAHFPKGISNEDS